MKKFSVADFLLKQWKMILSSAISFVVAYFFFALQNKTIELHFLEYPTKATIYKNGQLSNLRVLHEGTTITNDVTAIQVAIWNNGRASIRSINMLKPLIIYTDPRCRILDARFIMVSREVSELIIDKSFLDQGSLPVSWKIMEKNDGGIIQLIIEGDSNTRILCEGIVEGQGKIHVNEAYNQKYIYRYFSIVLLIVLISFCISAFVGILKESLKPGFKKRDYFYLFPWIFMFTLCIIMFYFAFKPSVPF